MATAKVSARSMAGATKDVATPPQLTCFVVTGFGNKTDYATGRVLNLDKTFELLVRPACDAVNVNAFRAIDANTTGSINTVMYHWIYAADLVIADLSTLNANVFYELGVRHALKPNTTFIIAESELLKRIPFDLGTFVVHKYDHDGDTIAKDVQQSFVKHLSDEMRKVIDGERDRLQKAPASDRVTDSPVFTYLQGLRAAQYATDKPPVPPAWVPPELRPKKGEDPGESLANLIDRAEAAKKAGKFAEAMAGFTLAIARQTEGKPRNKVKPDLFLVQRLALVTYKNGEVPGPDGKPDRAVAVQALRDAWEILKLDAAPDTTNDPETLGLSGAIHKRLFDWNGDIQDLNLSIWFYERGFYVKRDYYNGINAAYMYTLRSTLLANRVEAIVSHGHANMVRRQVVEICLELMRDPAAFNARGDKDWVVLTLAEAYQGLGRQAEVDRLAAPMANTANVFNQSTYREQRDKLQVLIDKYNRQVRPDDLQAAPAAPTTAAVTAAASAPVSFARATGAGQPITIDPPILPGRTVKSIEVTCKVEYD